MIYKDQRRFSFDHHSHFDDENVQTKTNVLNQFDIFAKKGISLKSVWRSSSFFQFNSTVFQQIDKILFSFICHMFNILYLYKKQKTIVVRSIFFSCFIFFSTTSLQIYSLVILSFSFNKFALTIVIYNEFDKTWKIRYVP